MTDQNTPGFQSGPGIFEDLRLAAFYRKVRRRLWLVLFLFISWVVVANLLFVTTPKVYSGVLEVTPASLGVGSSSGGGTLGGLIGSSFLGGALGGTSTDPIFKLYTESWTSSWLAKTIASNPAMLKEIFAEQWSEEKHGWKRPSGFLHAIAGLIKAVLGMRSSWSPPGTDAVHEYLSSHITVKSNRQSEITSIVAEDTDPKLAAAILQLGHRTISDHLREVFKTRAQQNSDYLVGRLQSVQVADYREALVNQLQQEQKFLMVAFSKSEFAAQPLGLHVTDHPVSPRPVEVLLKAFLIAAALYVALVFVADRLNWPTTLRELWLRRSNIAAHLRTSGFGLFSRI